MFVYGLSSSAGMWLLGANLRLLYSREDKPKAEIQCTQRTRFEIYFFRIKQSTFLITKYTCCGEIQLCCLWKQEEIRTQSLKKKKKRERLGCLVLLSSHMVLEGCTRTMPCTGESRTTLPNTSKEAEFLLVPFLCRSLNVSPDSSRVYNSFVFSCCVSFMTLANFWSFQKHVLNRT